MQYLVEAESAVVALLGLVALEGRLRRKVDFLRAEMGSRD